LGEKREQWDSRLGFLLATIGSAIGVGNIWRFPYIAYKNGGGAFLLPYFIALFSVGIPLLLLEQGLGHKMRASAPLAFRKIAKKFEWVGWWSIAIVMFGVVLYYTVIVSGCLNYLNLSLTLGWGTDPNMYFNEFVGSIDNPWAIGIPVITLLLGMLLIWVINWFIVYRGIRGGVEKACKLLIPVLMILMGILVIRGITLPGAFEGIKWYITPDFNALTNPSVWIDAYAQVFFSLGIGMGVVIAYSSYLPKKSDITGNALIIGFTNSLFSVFTGFAVFGILGHMVYTSGLPIDQVVQSGIGLAFIVFPSAFNAMAGSTPLFAKIFGALFFSSLIVAGISSSISMIEAFVSGLMDKFKVKRHLWVTIICILGFFGGIIFTTEGGFAWLDIVDHFLLSYGLVIVGLLEIIIVAWIFGSSRIIEHANKMSKIKIGYTLSSLLKIVTPLVLAIVLIFMVYTEIMEPYGGYPRSATMIIGFGWVIATFIIALLLSRMKWKTKVEDTK
jgi:neurotransmitter:Na+ symporter, NSS family